MNDSKHRNDVANSILSNPYPPQGSEIIDEKLNCANVASPPAKGGGLRFDTGKPRTDLLSPIALMGVSQVLARGAKKYGDSNWRKGMVWSKVIGPLLRHTFKFMCGEDLDVDKDCAGCKANDCKDHTGLPHVDLIATNAMFLQEYYRRHKDLDDRYKCDLEY